ncbi:hypothetical protein EMIT079MI2_90120 [Bacillus sp. IT-79MI2]
MLLKNIKASAICFTTWAKHWFHMYTPPFLASLYMKKFIQKQKLLMYKQLYLTILVKKVSQHKSSIIIFKIQKR